eukprot:COSAG05_NODE_34_length_27784_cov_62.890129_1_plen_112_part_00
MEAAEELPQESMLEDASLDSTVAEHDAMLDGETVRGDESSSDSTSSDDGELPIVAIVDHRDTKGQPDDPVLAYYTVRYELGGEEGGEEGVQCPPRRCWERMRTSVTPQREV